MPWSISKPSLSRCSVSFSAAICARVGRKPRKRVGGSKQKLLHAHEALHAVGERAVDRARVRAQKAIARLARASLDCLYGLLLCWRPRGLLRHHVDQPLGALPECAIAHAIGDQVIGLGRLVSKPFLDRVLRQCVGEDLDTGGRMFCFA